MNRIGGRNEWRVCCDVGGVARLGIPPDPGSRALTNGRQPPPAARAHIEPWWVTVRSAAGVFARQVLLRPLRIGMLVVLAAAVVAVVAGAQGWWVILGVVLFQTAGSLFIVLWTDGEAAEPEKRSPQRPDPPAPRQPEPDTQAEEPAESPDPDVPGQRTPEEE